MVDPVWIEADWPAPPGIRALTTTRLGGFSQPPYDSLNLGTNSGDALDAVALNRSGLGKALGLREPPCWLQQVHGTQVIRLEEAGLDDCADASVTSEPNNVCAVLTADCLPVFFASNDGREVGVAHTGWRGLAAGVLEATVVELRAEPQNIMAFLGPAIGPDSFEVGPEVRETFVAVDAENDDGFRAYKGDRLLCDIFKLARLHLNRCGIAAVYGGGVCTWSDTSRFYSYRRDGVTGRMASLIWIES